MVVEVKFNKDDWIRLAIQRAYLVVRKDGSIYRASKVSRDGYPDKALPYKLVKVQTHIRTGRVYFNLTFMGVTKSVLVNRVVAWRFHPNPLNLPVVNHKSGIKGDNSEGNLEWSTNSDNEKHAHQTGLKTGRGSSNSNAKLNIGDVFAIRDSHEDVGFLAKHYAVSRSTILNVIKRNTWSHV